MLQHFSRDWRFVFFLSLSSHHNGIMTHFFQLDTKMKETRRHFQNSDTCILKWLKNIFMLKAQLRALLICRSFFTHCLPSAKPLSLNVATWKKKHHLIHMIRRPHASPPPTPISPYLVLFHVLSVQPCYDWGTAVNILWSLWHKGCSLKVVTLFPYWTEVWVLTLTITKSRCGRQS